MKSTGVVNDEVLARAAAAVCKLSSEQTLLQDEQWPWRYPVTPYRVFLAEFLLVRTRADVVSKVFGNVIEMYPNIETLSKADESEIGILVRPLGLLKRVPYLIKAARYILDNYGGKIPSSVADLKKVPGIGNYTAAAIAAFAFDVKLVPADVNILRFFSRLTGLEMEHSTKGSRRLRELIDAIPDLCRELSVGAVLDFSRTVCKPRGPLCNKCLLRIDCRYAQSNPQEVHP